MFSFHNWASKYLTDGLALFPPQGPELGGVRIQHRVRPLRRIRDIVRDSVTRMGAAIREPQLSELEQFPTIEGEHAALITLAAQAQVDGHDLERTIGFVVGDDFYYRVDGLVHRREQFEMFRLAVRHLVFHAPLGLGELRRRRFLYAPPTGWQGRLRGATTEWFPHDFPADCAILSVPLVRHVREAPNAIFDRLLIENGIRFEREHVSEPTSIISDHGLSGSLVTLRGRYPGKPLTFYDVALLFDGRFLYLVRLESRPENRERHLPLFLRTVKSAQPVPAAEPEAMDQLIDWYAV